MKRFSKPRFLMSSVLILVAIGWLLSRQAARVSDCPNLTEHSPSRPALAMTSDPSVQTGQSNSVPEPDPVARVTFTVRAGGWKYELKFADSALSHAVRKIISDDLFNIFGHLPKVEIDVLPAVLEIDGKKFDRRVRFEGGSNRRPDVLINSGFAHVEVGAVEISLYVPRLVIKAYEDAVGLSHKNADAYLHLERFISDVNQVRVRPVQRVHELFLVADDFKSAEADLSAISASQFARGWGGKRYRAPSLLEVQLTSGTPLEKYGPLFAIAYALNDGKLEDLPLLIYSEGRWRFLLQRPPT